jgi:hypothetical protein
MELFWLSCAERGHLETISSFFDIILFVTFLRVPESAHY